MLKHGAFCEVDILMHAYIPVLPAPLRPGLAQQSGAGGARPGKSGTLRGEG
jgi:hypothetical protein